MKRCKGCKKRFTPTQRGGVPQKFCTKTCVKKNWPHLIIEKRESWKRWDHRNKAKGFGITFAELKELLKGPCAICGSLENILLDHSHLTGKLRGPLCRSCNLGIGWFKDDVELLGRAIGYLKQFTDC